MDMDTVRAGRMRERPAWLLSGKLSARVLMVMTMLALLTTTTWRMMVVHVSYKTAWYSSFSKTSPTSPMEEVFGANEPLDVHRDDVLGDAGIASVSKLLKLISSWEAQRSVRIQGEDLICVQSLLFKERIPFALVQAFQDADRRRLCRLLDERRKSLIWNLDETDMGKYGGLNPSILFAQPDYGLGNRLRALAAMLAHASGSGMLPVVLWSRNEHLNASFHDLFAANQQILVIEDFNPSIFPWCAVENDPNCAFLHELNFILSENPQRTHPEKFSWQKDQKRATKEGKRHFYVKTAYVLRSDYNYRIEELRVDAVGVFLRRLVPSRAVLELITDTLTALPIPIKNAVGVHVRSLLPELEFTTPEAANFSDADLEVLRMKQKALYGTHGYDTLARWRSSTGPEIFIRHLAEMEQSQHFFVASDSAVAYDLLASTFPGRVHRLTGDMACGGPRQRTCVRRAFAEIILLGSTGQLRGSGYSSFSEVAKRRGDIPMLLAGKHF